MLTAETTVPAYTWLTVKEAALRMRVSPAQIRRWIAAGELESMDVAENAERPGHRPTWRVKPSSVADMIRRRTRGGKAAA